MVGVVISYVEEQNEPCVPSCLVRVPTGQAERERFLCGLFRELNDLDEGELEYSEVSEFGDFEVSHEGRYLFVTLCEVPD
jgi:hypothetical protein